MPSKPLSSLLRTHALTFTRQKERGGERVINDNMHKKKYTQGSIKERGASIICTHSAFSCVHLLWTGRIRRGSRFSPSQPRASLAQHSNNSDVKSGCNGEIKESLP